jgi:hypothetical protein
MLYRSGQVGGGDHLLDRSPVVNQSEEKALRRSTWCNRVRLADGKTRRRRAKCPTPFIIQYIPLDKARPTNDVRHVCLEPGFIALITPGPLVVEEEVSECKREAQPETRQAKRHKEG